MRYTYKISDIAIIDMLKACYKKYDKDLPVSRAVSYLNEHILGSEKDILNKLIEDLAEIDYFCIRNGKIIF